MQWLRLDKVIHIFGYRMKHQGRGARKLKIRSRAEFYVPIPQAVPFPPPHLIIAHKDRDDEVRNKTLVAIERKKGGVTSENQKKGISLNEAGTRLLYVGNRMQRLSLLSQ